MIYSDSSWGVPMRTGTRAAWLAVLLLVGLGIALAWLALGSVIDKDVALWARWFIAAVGVIAAWSFAITTRKSGTPWLSAHGVAVLAGACLAGFATMSALNPNFSPRPAVERVPGAIEADADKIARWVDEQNSRPSVLVGLPGRWGRMGCAEPLGQISVSDGTPATIRFEFPNYVAEAEVRGTDGNNVFLRQTYPTSSTGEYTLTLSGNSLSIDTMNSDRDRTLYRCE